MEGNNEYYSNLILILRSFILLSRLPFHSVGVLPFVLGTVLAMHDGYELRTAILFFGILGTVFIMLATYLSGEYYDKDEDTETGHIGKSRFSGGSQVIQQGQIAAWKVLIAGVISLIIAAGIGLFIWLGLGTGPLTLPLGILGMIGGFLYSAKPVRWVSRGLGELWIACCYGWLPVAAAYYLQAGNIPLSVSLISVPVSFSIVAVILINEFADYEADKKWGKRNLLVLIGYENGAALYMGLVLASVISSGLLAAWFSAPMFVQAPVILLGIVLCACMKRRYWMDHNRREWICGGTILLNLSISGAWIISLVW